MVWYAHLFKNFPQFVVIHTIKGFGTVDKVEVDVFWNSLAFSIILWVLAIWSMVPVPFIKLAWTPGSSWFTYCWSLAWRILSNYFASMRWVQFCSSLNSLWHCLSLELEWKLTFSSPLATAKFSKFAGILSAAFELWCWRRLLQVPWMARRSSQSILKEISPECSLEGLMLKL